MTSPKHPVSPAAARPASELAIAFGAFAVFLIAALVAFSPALKGEFLWDDVGHVTSPALQSWSGLFRIWFEPGATQQYYPFLHSAFWVEHQLWGDATSGYHLVNVVLHTASATLFALLLRRLAIPGAWWAAALFLLHPVTVESVAWICEQKNTLSLALYLSAALAYLHFDTTRAPRAYALALGLFTLALLTKTVTATLPAALLVVAWWRRGRLSWKGDVVPVLPWFILGAAGGLFTAHFERTAIGAQGADFTLGAADRLVLAGRVFWFYLGKLIWPVDLSFVYPRWQVDAAAWWQWLFPAAGVALLVGLVRWSRRSRGPLAAALLFAGSLFPVLGFVNVYPFVFSYVADHFQYLASLAVFALAGALLVRLPALAGKLVPATLAVVLGVLTWHQAADYRDNATLYEATLLRNPDAWLARLNLATLLADRGDFAAALPHLERAQAIKPDDPGILSALGNTLFRLGRPADALAPLQRALEIQPRHAEATNNLGAVLMALGRADEGRARFAAAVQLQPDFASARLNLGRALAAAGRLADATPHLTRAVELEPENTAARTQLGTALAMQARYAEALPHFDAVVQQEPESADAHLRLAMTLRALGRTDDANAEYREAIRLNPALGR